MIKRSIEGNIIKDFTMNTICISLKKSILPTFLIQIRSLDYHIIESIKIVDIQRKDSIIIKKDKNNFRIETNELSLGRNEFEVLEKLILEYINDVYCLNEHIDMEIPFSETHIDLTVTVDID